jgi:hypothetical protein
MNDCPVSPNDADDWLEPDAGRLARPVLRGRWRSNVPPLPDIGVDSQTGLAHSAVVTAANVHDKHPRFPSKRKIVGNTGRCHTRIKRS